MCVYTIKKGDEDDHPVGRISGILQHAHMPKAGQYKEPNPIGWPIGQLVAPGPKLRSTPRDNRAGNPKKQGRRRHVAPALPYDT